LLPMVYRNLQASPIAEPLLPRLKGSYRYWWCSNQDLFYQASRLIETLHAAGIPTLVLKGAATAVLHYRDAGVRPMADVDVLVPPGRARDAIRCLERQGWRPATASVDEEIRYHHSVALVNEAGREVE